MVSSESSTEYSPRPMLKSSMEDLMIIISRDGLLSILTCG